MKSLLDIQREIKGLETAIHEVESALSSLHQDIQEIRTADDDLEMDYDMIRTLANNISFQNHPLAKLESGYACKIYIELLICVMRMDMSSVVEKMTYIQWILKESEIDADELVLEDAYRETLELNDKIYAEMGEELDEEYRAFFIVDALVVANFAGRANAATTEYVARLCSLLGMDAQQVEECTLLARIILCQNVDNIKRTDIEKILPIIKNYAYCIRKEEVEKAFISQREICVEVYNDDLWGSYSLSWKVEQKSHVNSGEIFAEYRPKQGSTTSVKASKSGMLFQFEISNNSWWPYSIGSLGVIAHPCDTGEQIEAWLNKTKGTNNAIFKLVDEGDRS